MPEKKFHISPTYLSFFPPQKTSNIPQLFPTSKNLISNKCFIHSPTKKRAKTLLLSFGLINKSDSDIVVVRDY
jgi:hypothetical protein